MGDRMYWELTKTNIPLVGCRANEIENLLTAEPRVASEKEKHRYLKCTTANRKKGLRKEQKKATVSGHAGGKGKEVRGAACFRELGVLGFCQADCCEKTFPVALVLCSSKRQQDVREHLDRIEKKNNQASP